MSALLMSSYVDKLLQELCGFIPVINPLPGRIAQFVCEAGSVTVKYSSGCIMWMLGLSHGFCPWKYFLVFKNKRTS